MAIDKYRREGGGKPDSFTIRCVTRLSGNNPRYLETQIHAVAGDDVAPNLDECQ